MEKISIVACPCKFPLILKKDEMDFIALPLTEFERGDIVQLPLIYRKKDERGDWVVVQWKDELHEGVKSYDVADHIVMAGCEKDQLECDSGSVYLVMHPAEEWEKYHMIESK